MNVLRLAISDMRWDGAVWVGLLMIAVVAGAIGEFSVLVNATADYQEESLRRTLADAGTIVAVFSWVAAIPVLSRASKLLLLEKEAVHALWRIGYAKDRQIAIVVLVQLGTVAILGALVGAAVMMASFRLVFPIVFSSRSQLENVVPVVTGNNIGWVCCEVFVLFLLGSVSGVIRAARISPAIAINHVSRIGGIKHRSALLRIACLLILLVLLFAMLGSEFEVASMVGLLVPLVSTLVFGVASSSILPLTMRLWSIVDRCNGGYALSLACKRALQNSGVSVAIEAPIMVLISLITGFVSSMHVVESCSNSIGHARGTGFEIDFSLALLVFGGPILIGFAGAFFFTFMSSRTRNDDSRLLALLGVGRSRLLVVATYEALIHTVTALLCGLICGASSAIVVWSGLKMRGLLLIDILPGALVSILGFILISGSMTVSVAKALRSMFPE